jgi:preprotein translocase subunit YajC
MALVSTALASGLVANSGDSGGGGSAIFQLGFLLLIPLAMYFLLIRPQRRRVKEQQQVQSSLAVGDEVITTSGIYGTITGEDGASRFWVEIDDDVQVRVARAAIQGKASTDDDSADDDAGGDDTDEDVDDSAESTAD